MNLTDKTLSFLEDKGYKKIGSRSYGYACGDLISCMKLPTGKSKLSIHYGIYNLADPLWNFSLHIVGLGGLTEDRNVGRENSGELKSSVISSYIEKTIRNEIIPLFESIRTPKDCIARVLGNGFDSSLSLPLAFWYLSDGNVERAREIFFAARDSNNILFRSSGPEAEEVEYFSNLFDSKENIDSALIETLEDNRIENVYRFKLHKLFPKNRFGRKARVPAVLRDEYE